MADQDEISGSNEVELGVSLLYLSRFDVLDVCCKPWYLTVNKRQ